MNLGRLVLDVYEVRTSLRMQGATEQDIEATTLRMVRERWEPLVPSERFWPAHHLAPKCGYCDGTGLMMARNVTNRLGIVVDEGAPCRCPKGARFEPKAVRNADHTAAGKTPKQNTLSRFGRQ